jgi:hypothetical protein
MSRFRIRTKPEERHSFKYNTWYTTMATPHQDTKLVIVDYSDLLEASSDEKLMECCEQAFGDEGIGIIGIANVPGFVEAKAKVLQQAHPLAHLPENELKELEDPESMYNAGWSHGKEMYVNYLVNGALYERPIASSSFFVLFLQA